MVRRGVVIVVALVLGGIVLAVVSWPWQRGPTGPVYTVTQVYNGLAHHPGAWVGRTVTVRGTLVLMEWHTQEQNWLDDTSGEDACLSVHHCTMTVPTNADIDAFLVPKGPYTSARAYATANASLANARSTLPPGPSTANLVVLVPPSRAQLALADPRPHQPLSIVLVALAHVPLIGSLLIPAEARVQGGTPRLYRLRLWARPSMLPGTCSPACADGELLDNLY